MKYIKFLSFPLYNSESIFFPFQAFKNLKRYQKQIIEIQFSIKKTYLYFKKIKSETKSKDKTKRKLKKLHRDKNNRDF